MWRMGKVLTTALVLLMMPHGAQTQAGDQEAAKNAQQARAALNAMVQALGGQAWSTCRTICARVTLRRFSIALPTWERRKYFEYHQWPDHDQIEYTKHRDVVQFYLGEQGLEVTYRG